MQTRHETIVVGAGPAGCAAAYDLAAAGRDVLLLDKAEFPRLKPCAGALTIKTLNSLRFDVSPVVRRTCREMKLSLGATSRTLANGGVIAALTVRSEFDGFSLRKCVERGVNVGTGHRLIGLARDPDGWIVSTNRAEFRCRFLIGADGANSEVRHLLMPKKALAIGLALETCVPTGDWPDTAMEFDFGSVDRGYGWVFPKDDHLNVGLYTLNPTIPHAAEKLAAFTKAKTGKQISREIHGHKIPHNGRRIRQGWKNVCLIGDAAGLIDPFLGEGIYHAVRSGQLAASAIVHSGELGDADFSGGLREINRDLASYDSETRRFYANIHRGYRRLAKTPLGGLLVKGFTKGWTVREIKRGLFSLIVR